jgi:hypothetical protein
MQLELINFQGSIYIEWNQFFFYRPMLPQAYEPGVLKHNGVVPVQSCFPVLHSSISETVV